MHDNLFKEGFLRYGEQSELKVVMEELSELSAAVSHYSRRKIDKYTLSKEIADVELMLEKIKWYWDLEESLKEARKEQFEKMVSNIKGGSNGEHRFCSCK